MPDRDGWESAYRSVESVRTWTDREIGSILREPMAAWTDCMLFVGQSDQLFREAERAEELDIEAGRAISARRRANRLNNLAIDTLDERIPAAVEVLRGELRDLPRHDLDRPLQTFQDTIYEKLLDLDLRGDQTRLVADRIRGAMDIGRQSGVPGLCDLLLDNARELSRLRHRRTEHNDPVLTIIAAGCAVLAGIIFAVCTANNGGNPCNDGIAITFAVLLFGMAVAIMFAQFIHLGGVFAS
jgi:hypothetical protein